MNKIILVSIITISVHAAVIESKRIETSWSLKEDLMEIESNPFVRKNSHQFKFGLANKNLSALSLKSNNNTFKFNELSLPGLTVNYDYNFKFSKFWLSIYSNIGYFTTYNDLGTQGFADLSSMEANLGMGFTLPLFEQRLLPKIFFGLGHDYFFQRGDVSEVSADENYNVMESGLDLEYAFNSNSSFPSSWNSKYLFGIRYSEINVLNSQTKLSGNKLVLTVGVEL